MACEYLPLLSVLWIVLAFGTILIWQPPLIRAQAGPQTETPSAPVSTPAPSSPAPPVVAAPSFRKDPPGREENALYIRQLRLKAARLKLADTRFWHVLMHYKPAWFGVESEADGPGFFLAANGKYDPQAELDATIAAFFSPKILSPGNMTAQCTFPARYRWLKEQLGFEPDRLIEETCDRFLAWQKALNPESATFIFASYFLINPASAFGHTLIRFDRAQRGEGERLLDYAVNFAAAVRPDENGFVYAFNGLTGGYKGYFSILPYYAKVREYSDIDSRDLWEYRLSLTPDQVDWMLRHTWEMGSTWFDYYFFDENCSYHLLGLLEVADPTLHLQDRFHFWTLPTDTVRAVTDQPGLVKSVLYRPSRSSQMQQKLDQLSSREQAMVVQFIAQPDIEPAGFADLPALTQALILDAASDYYQLKLGGDEEGDKVVRAKLRSLLLRRSKLRVTYDAEAFPPQSQPPETGHRTSRLSVALGEAGPGGHGTLDPTAGGRTKPFVDLEWQPVFHELLSDSQGYARNTQIQLGDTLLRYEEYRDRVDLERFTVVDAIALRPLTQVIRQPSWRLNVAVERTHDGACRGCTPAVADGEVGGTLETQDKRVVAYVLAVVDAEFDQALTDGYRAGLGLHVGTLVDVTSTWRAHLEASRVQYSSGQTGWTDRAALTQRVTLGRDWELRVDLHYVESDRLSAYRELKVGVGWFY